MTVLGSTVSGNTATGDGGGIFNATDAVATMHGTIVEVNSAGLDGGGIFNQGTVTLRGVRLRDNTPNDCTGC